MTSLLAPVYAAVLLVVAATRVDAQGLAEGAWVGSALDHAQRIAALADTASTKCSLTLRPLPCGDRAPVPTPWRARFVRPDGPLAVLAPQGLVEHNGALPEGGNDDALWAGRGLSAQFTAGARLRLWRVSATLAPSAFVAQNAAFTLLPVASANTHPAAAAFFANSIDWPQRPADAAFGRATWGQSDVYVEGLGLAIGASHQAMWWGPGIFNALVQSNNAGGFPHVYVGTPKPVAIGRLARMEFQWLTGTLRGSGRQLTTGSTRDRTRFGFAAAVQPSALPGVTLGVTRVFHDYRGATGGLWDELRTTVGALQKSRQASEENSGGEDPTDQVASLFARWAFPASRSELYFEWAKGDHSWDVRDILIQPDHGQGWLLGAARLLGDPDRPLALRAEWFSTTRPTASATRSQTGRFFGYHGRVREGTTHFGQLLGAAVGPSAMQLDVRAERLHVRGGHGLSFRWARREDAALFVMRREPNRRPPDLAAAGVAPEATLHAQAFWRRFTGPVDQEWSVGVTQWLNRGLRARNDATNLTIGARLAWIPR